MSPVWAVAEIGFYAKDEAEAELIFDRLAAIACRGEIGMGLHVCQTNFSAGMTSEQVTDEEWRNAWDRA